MQEKHHPKSLLWEKGPFSLVKAQKKSKSLFLQGCYIQRARNVLQRKGWRGWRTWGAREGGGFKGGEGTNPPDSQGQGDMKPGGLPMEEYTLEI